jgi:PIN domain nuclease of toxin-antitoxin system
MGFILDTHTFIWYFNGDDQLSKMALSVLDDKSQKKYLSIASLWEIAIKVNVGKLELSYPFYTIEEKLAVNKISLLEVSFEYTKQLISLELHHRDPFDRMIISQSIIENLTVISKDKNFSLYPIKPLW